jgi:hypothetical protein
MTDLHARYRPFQVNVNERRGETNANPATALENSAQKNEPIHPGFPHLQVKQDTGINGHLPDAVMRLTGARSGAFTHSQQKRLEK